MASLVDQINHTPTAFDEREAVYSTGMAQDKRFDGLDRRVGEVEKTLKQIERKLELPLSVETPTVPKAENWLKRNAYWLTVAGSLTPVALLPISLVFGWFSSVFDVRIATKLNEPNGLNAQIQKLSTEVATANGELGAIRRLWEDQLKKTGQLTPQEFQKTLPQAAETMRAAAVLKVSLPQQTANALQNNLLAASPQAPGYWPAVSEFIAYKSSAYAVVLPRCGVRTSDSGTVQVTHPDGSREEPTKLLRVTLTGCFLDLDEDKVVVAFGCNQCLIKYSGGSLTLKDVVFKDCMFLLALQSEPPTTGKVLVQPLLSRRDMLDVRI